MRIWIPGKPGVAGIESAIVETEKTGWSSGAVSIPVITGDGGYEFYIPSGVVGVVCGLADDFSGIGYRTINHALHFSRGSVSLLEFGDIVQSLGSYGSGDKFVIWRQGGAVFVSQNGVLIAHRSGRLGASFRLASSMFLKGDTIVDAKVAVIAANRGVGDAALGALKALGMQGSNNFGVAEIGPLTSTASSDNHASGASVLSGVQVLASDKHYAFGAAQLGAFDAYAESGVTQPAWSSGDGWLSGVSTFGHSFTGAVGTGSASLHRVEVMASDRVYGSADAELGEVFAFGAQEIHISMGLLVMGGHITINGKGEEVDVNGINAVLPPLTLDGRFGHQMKLTAPKLEIEVSGDFTPVLRGEMTLPSLGVVGKGVTGGVMTAELSLNPLLVDLRSGWVGVLNPKGGYSIDASGVSGGVGRGELKFNGRVDIEASGTVRELTVWSLTGPSVTVAPTGQAWLVTPKLTMYAQGEAVVTATYEAYAINLTTGAVSHYTNYPFDNILRFGDRFFGVKSDGIFELTGDTDLGAPVLSKIKTFRTNFGASNLKRVPWVYVAGRSSPDMVIGVQADEQPVTRFRTWQAPNYGTHLVRAKCGANVKGSYYSFTFENVEGRNFEIDRVEALVDTTTRAI